MCLQKSANCKSLLSKYSLCDAELWVHREWFRTGNSGMSLATSCECLRQHLGPIFSTALWSDSSCGAHSFFTESVMYSLSNTPHMCPSMWVGNALPLRWKWCWQHPSSEGTCFVSDSDEPHQLSWASPPPLTSHLEISLWVTLTIAGGSSILPSSLPSSLPSLPSSLPPFLLAFLPSFPWLSFLSGLLPYPTPTLQIIPSLIQSLIGSMSSM